MTFQIGSVRIHIHRTPDRWGYWRFADQHRIAVAAAGWALNAQRRKDHRG